jgi:galactose mutarotase-like enzyme
MHGVSTVEGIETIAIASSSGDLRATFAPDAGMVCCSLLHDGQELLAQRGGLRTYAERGSTMGIPLLHPWANRLARSTYGAPPHLVELDPRSPLVRRDEHGLPIHGVIASRLPWRVLDLAPASLHARMVWESPDLLAVFPYSHRLDVRVSIDARAFRIETSMCSLGAAATPLPVSFGYHPYLTLPGTDRRGWRVELPAACSLVLDDLNIPTGALEPVDHRSFELGESSWDDGFQGLSEPALFAVSAAGRRISLALLEGYSCAQVFAPARESFICFEPMTSPTNALVSRRDLATVNPGEEFRAAFEVSVSALSS